MIFLRPNLSDIGPARSVESAMKKKKLIMMRFTVLLGALKSLAIVESAGKHISVESGDVNPSNIMRTMITRLLTVWAIVPLSQGLEECV